LACQTGPGPWARPPEAPGRFPIVTQAPPQPPYAQCMLLLAAALLLAVDDGVANPRFTSANGEWCVVVRQHADIPDFERITDDEYFRRLEAAGEFNEPLPGDSPKPPVPQSGALYRIWPSGYRELLSEFTFRANEGSDRVLVADDGHVVTHNAVRCEREAELLTIRAADGSIVRTVRVRDVVTAHDQAWLCAGSETDVRLALEETLRITMLVTPGRWNDPDARQHTVEVDLGTGAVPAPKEDQCPPALRVTAEADDGLPRYRSDADVVPIGSQALLDRALVRVEPEYPIVARKARISGRVGVQVRIGRDGRVEEATIVKPLPFGLDQAVRDAILKWEFTPDESRVSGVLAFRFELLRSPVLETFAVN